jgi:hypothetical protein
LYERGWTISAIAAHRGDDEQGELGEQSYGLVVGAQAAQVEVGDIRILHELGDPLDLPSEISKSRVPAGIAVIVCSTARRRGARRCRRPEERLARVRGSSRRPGPSRDRSCGGSGHRRTSVSPDVDVLRSSMATGASPIRTNLPKLVNL